MADDFIILGDLTERVLGGYVSPARRLIVRMFVGDETFDEEIDVDTVDEVRGKVAARMTALAKKPDRNLKTEAERPQIFHGHAIALPDEDA